MDDLFEILPILLETFPSSAPVRQAVVFAVFRKAAGEGLLNHAVPKELDAKKLTVAVADTVWERHMRSLAPGLIARINQLAGSSIVTFIDFVVEETLFETDSNARISKENNEKRAVHSVPADLRKKAALIRDDELRRVFLESAGVYLAARDKRDTNS